MAQKFPLPIAGIGAYHQGTRAVLLSPPAGFTHIRAPYPRPSLTLFWRAVPAAARTSCCTCSLKGFGGAPAVCGDPREDCDSKLGGPTE